MIAWSNNKYPDGRFKRFSRAFCAVRAYGDYEVKDYSADTLMPEKTSDNFESLRPWLLRVGKYKRYYIGAEVLSAERKKAKKDDKGNVIAEEKELYNYLPVYRSLNFGSLCVGRLCEVKEEKGVWLGSVDGMTVKVDLDNVRTYEKKDGTDIKFCVAEVSFVSSY